MKQQGPHVSRAQMSCKKRSRPSPIVDPAEADPDDAALRKELCKKKQVKAKTAFSNGACLKALTQTSAPSVAVVTLFSAMALNYYMKNGPSLSEAPNRAWTSSMVTHRRRRRPPSAAAAPLPTRPRQITGPAVPGSARFKVVRFPVAQKPRSSKRSRSCSRSIAAKRRPQSRCTKP